RLGQTLAERANDRGRLVWRTTAKEPNYGYRLLRARRERPRGRRAAEQRDEVAAFQSIELHSVPATKPDRRISNWRWSVSGYQGVGFSSSRSCRRRSRRACMSWLSASANSTPTRGTWLTCCARAFSGRRQSRHHQESETARSLGSGDRRADGTVEVHRSAEAEWPPG